MNSENAMRTEGTSSLELTLKPLRPLLARPEVTELCINRPGEIFLETHRGWEREEIPFADFDWCLRLARLIAHYTRQRINEESPLLSATLPSGERVQIVIPPATTPGRCLIRTSYMATHTDEMLDRALGVIEKAGKKLGVIQ